jgi:hypothetical protein
LPVGVAVVVAVVVVVVVVGLVAAASHLVLLCRPSLHGKEVQYKYNTVLYSAKNEYEMYEGTALRIVQVQEKPLLTNPCLVPARSSILDESARVVQPCKTSPGSETLRSKTPAHILAASSLLGQQAASPGCKFLLLLPLWYEYGCMGHSSAPDP